MLLHLVLQLSVVIFLFLVYSISRMVAENTLYTDVPFFHGKCGNLGRSWNSKTARDSLREREKKATREELGESRGMYVPCRRNFFSQRLLVRLCYPNRKEL